MTSKASTPEGDSDESPHLIDLIEGALTTPSLEAFGDHVLPRIRETTRATAGFLFLADSQRCTLHFTSFGFQPETASEIKDWCIKEFECNHAHADPAFFSQSVTDGMPSNIAMYPLRDNGRCHGLLGVRKDETTSVISGGGLARTLAILAKMAGQLFERAELDKKLSHLNTYLTVSSMLTQSLDLHELLNVALNCCMEAVSADAASVLILDDEKKNFNFYQVEGRANPLLTSATFPADKGLAGSVLKTREPELINDASGDPRFFNNFDSQTGFQTKNMIAIPLVAGEEAIGVLEVLNKAEGGMFTKEELLLLVSLAEEMAFAIRNAKVFEYVVNTYCRQRQGHTSCKGCKRPLGSWTPCVKYRETSI